jgi:hypothetical protein
VNLPRYQSGGPTCVLPCPRTMDVPSRTKKVSTAALVTPEVRINQFRPCTDPRVPSTTTPGTSHPPAGADPNLA